MDEFLNSLTPEQRQFCVSVSYELAVNGEIIKSMSMEQRDVLIAIIAKIINDGLVLDDNDEESENEESVQNE